TWKRDNIKPVPMDAGGDAGYEYRWGWTAPILLSQHDSTMLYVGANRLFRLHDRGARGIDFEILGPDMTREDRSHPAPEGGNTSYHALFSIAESPRDRNVVWTGSDDGLVWLTRDGGATWTNLTPNLPKAAPTTCFVSAIAPSHQDAAAAWLTYDCHHRDDYQPHVYRTTDYGRTWTAMVRGLPADAGSLTVYADPFNPRLAWVGTSIGAYVTVDGGRQWQRMGRNLPYVPVEKFALSYRQRELVLGTHGRGAWVADVRALEEMSDTLLAERAHLFAVPPVLQYRYADTYPSFGSRPWMAPNPARGAVISYWLRDAQPATVDLYVTSAAGDTVRKLTGPGYAGLQSVTWDLGRDKPRPRELGGPTDPRDLRRVEPGEYTVTLTVGGRKLSQRIRVEDWPRGWWGVFPDVSGAFVERSEASSWTRPRCVQVIREAPVGIEPTNSRFAVCRLTTWPRRRAPKLTPRHPSAQPASLPGRAS
ncbi:MAG: glycosyl hydrolase, repeat, partial [Gemmatimonadetes bacterium]|nr:glycosyl hydrolase, repeat [Gemmatimonadota bacterium]